MIPALHEILSPEAHSLTCVMGIITDELTGKLKAVRVCSYCERDKKETQFLESYLATLGDPPITHSICPECARVEREKLKVE